MTDTAVIASRTDAIATIRNEPVQARSTARLAALLDAAAHVIDEIGYERLTTAMVAERAGASIGTVYRYFPDRIAVLQSLAARNVERTGERAIAELSSHSHNEWSEALTASYRILVDAFRDEPGFAALRYGDVLDLRPFVGVPALRVLADRMAVVLVERFGMNDTPEARLAIESAVTLTDAIAADAFQRDPSGDQQVLAHAGIAARALLAEYFPRSAR
ncbi:TetR/AcrR family transcriptional regulator [Lysinimonas soli]|uniref:TetR/AcrR family transcriptional regulator n=1 Tax=Lysinimonas soli TaxID=1074233 RepID=A0ABW0NRP9_9MICO